MNDPAIMRMFADLGAIISDSHFVYTSGRHSSVYINKDALYLHTEAISSLCHELARPFDSDQVDVVVGPVLGGIVLSQWVTHHLNTRRTRGETLAIFAEKGGDGANGLAQQFMLTRGYGQYIPGKKILLVEDVLTTGGSVRQVIELLRRLDGDVIGVSALCNRGDVQPADIGGVPIHALLALTLQTYSAAECPFCQQGTPINIELGKGRAFLARQKVV